MFAIPIDRDFSTSSQHTAAIAGSVVGVLLLCLILFIGFLLRRRRLRTQERQMFVTEEYKPPPFSPGGAFGASARNSGYATFDGNEMDVGPGATKQGRVTGYFRNIFHRSTGSESSDHYVHESSILPAVHIRVNRSVNNTRDNHFSIPADPFASPGLTPGQYSSGPANGDNSSRENLRPNSFQSASSASLYTDESSIHNS